MSFLQQLSNHYHNLLPFDKEINEETKKKFNILDVEGLMYKETYTDWMCFTETGDIILPLTGGENIKIAKNNLGSIVFREKNSSIQYNGEDYPIPNISFQETKKVFESFKIFHQEGRIEMFESITVSERVEDWIVNTPINWKKIIFYGIAALLFIGWFIDSPSDLSDIESRQEGVEIIKELTEDYFDEYKELSDEYISNGGTLTDKKHEEMDDIKAKFLEMKKNVDNSDLPYEDKTYLVELIYSNWDDITEKTTANWKLIETAED